MPHSSALYYPWIEIPKSLDGWLKTACLYWDNIRTIVPESIEDPYKSSISKSLMDEDILRPIRVSSSMEEIEELYPAVLDFIESQEAKELFLSRELKYGHRIHTEKLPYTLQRLADIHPDKLPSELRRMLREGRDGWFEVDEEFASFYMTLLASKLSERIGACLLTNIPESNRLAQRVRLENAVPPIRRGRRRWEYDAWERRRALPPVLVQGMLVDMILENIELDPETPIERIIKFRRDHSSELGRFRAELEEITSSFTDDMPVEAMRQRVSDLHQNRVQPAINDLQNALRGSRITWMSKSLLRIAFISTGTSSALVTMGLSVPTAILVGAGVSISAHGILYNEERKEKIRENPYNYILSAKKSFG